MMDLSNVKVETTPGIYASKYISFQNDPIGTTEVRILKESYPAKTVPMSYNVDLFSVGNAPVSEIIFVDALQKILQLLMYNIGQQFLPVLLVLKITILIS